MKGRNELVPVVHCENALKYALLHTINTIKYEWKANSLTCMVSFDWIKTTRLFTFHNSRDSCTKALCSIQSLSTTKTTTGPQTLDFWRHSCVHNMHYLKLSSYQHSELQRTYDTVTIHIIITIIIIIIANDYYLAS